MTKWHNILLLIAGDNLTVKSIPTLIFVSTVIEHDDDVLRIIRVKFFFYFTPPIATLRPPQVWINNKIKWQIFMLHFQIELVYLLSCVLFSLLLLCWYTRSLYSAPRYRFRSCTMNARGCCADNNDKCTIWRKTSVALAEHRYCNTLRYVSPGSWLSHKHGPIM